MYVCISMHGAKQWTTTDYSDSEVQQSDIKSKSEQSVIRGSVDQSLVSL